MKKKKNKYLQDAEPPLADTPEEGLSADEIELLQKTRPELDRSTLPPHDNSDLARAKRFAKKNKFTVIFVASTLLLLLVILGVLCFMLYKNSLGKPSTDDFSVTLGDEKFTVPYKSAMRDDVFYFDLRLISDYADLVVSGGEGNMKFTCPDGTYVRFEHGKDTATVNGVRVLLGGTAEIIPQDKESAAKCFVPFDFIEKLFSHKVVGDRVSLGIVFSNKDNKIKIKRIVYNESGNPLPISFSPNCFESAERKTADAYSDMYPELTYLSSKLTTLVNKNNPLGNSYVPRDLLSLDELGCPVTRDQEFFLVADAAYALCDMLRELNASLSAKEQVSVTSAYRSYEYQINLYDSYVEELMEKQHLSKAEAEEKANKTSARPGYSEHQSGLCVDLIRRGDIALNEGFEDTPAFGWLKENAHRYGFIVRYPRSKDSITGYDYEPWHFRFVGIDAATVIYEDNICLEEYLAVNEK